MIIGNPLEILYKTVEVIKEGKNGKVLLVVSLADDKKKAKRFFVKKERALKTAEIYERLKDIKSPNLPKIYHTLEFEGKFFIVEEFINGRTLADYLEHNNGLNEKQSAQVLRQLCECLKIIHAQKIIHRDIKPSNVILTEDNVVKLIDFSISRIEKENKTNDTDFLGTQGYAAPEQFGFKQTDSRTDIYSLGVTIQKLLGENYNGYLKKILAKCTEIDPDKRYQSVDEILADMNKKYFSYKIKKAAIKLTEICATIFFIVTGVQKFFEVPAPKIESKPAVVEVNPVDKKFEKVKPRENPVKVEWAEIKIPEPENYNSREQPTLKISEINTLPNDETVTDPRLNQICTLTLNGKTYSLDDSEISPEIWQAWKIEGDTVYLPENFSVSFNLENKNSAPLNVSIKANLKGLQTSEKVFPATIAAGQSKTFEIPIGGLACDNGNFEVEIWLTENNEPLFGFWNNENFDNHGTIIIYLTDYNKWRTQKKI